jgi:signal peptidase I
MIAVLRGAYGEMSTKMDKEMKPSTELNHHLSKDTKDTKLRDKLGLPGWGLLLFIPVILLLSLALVVVILGGPRTVDGPSMYPTLHDGDRVFFLKYRFGSKPTRGDIVILNGPTSDPVPIIKRVFAVAGDTITSEGGLLVLNSRRPHENVHSLRPWPDKLAVPKNTIFVVGDNESNSTDSRIFGPVPVKNVNGKAVLILWPLSRIRRL